MRRNSSAGVSGPADRAGGVEAEGARGSESERVTLGSEGGSLGDEGAPVGSPGRNLIRTRRPAATSSARTVSRMPESIWIPRLERNPSLGPPREYWVQG